MQRKQNVIKQRERIGLVMIYGNADKQVWWVHKKTGTNKSGELYKATRTNRSGEHIRQRGQTGLVGM